MTMKPMFFVVGMLFCFGPAYAVEQLSDESPTLTLLFLTANSPGRRAVGSNYATTTQKQWADWLASDLEEFETALAKGADVNAYGCVEYKKGYKSVAPYERDSIPRLKEACLRTSKNGLNDTVISGTARTSFQQLITNDHTQLTLKMRLMRELKAKGGDLSLPSLEWNDRQQQWRQTPFSALSWINFHDYAFEAKKQFLELLLELGYQVNEADMNAFVQRRSRELANARFSNPVPPVDPFSLYAQSKAAPSVAKYYETRLAADIKRSNDFYGSPKPASIASAPRKYPPLTKTTLTIGQQICVFGTGDIKVFTGQVGLGGYQIFRTVPGSFEVRGFVEDIKGDKIKILVAGMSSIKDGAISKEPLDSFDYRGNQLKNGSVIWDSFSNWSQC